MLSIEKNFCETLSEEVVLFTEDGSPYYVSPAASKVLCNQAKNNNSLFEEISRIVYMISTLKLKLSYIMPLESAPLGSAVKCTVSKFGHGYKARLIKDDIAKSHAVATEVDVHDTCYELKVVT